MNHDRDTDREQVAVYAARSGCPDRLGRGAGDARAAWAPAPVGNHADDAYGRAEGSAWRSCGGVSRLVSCVLGAVLGAGAFVAGRLSAPTAPAPCDLRGEAPASFRLVEPHVLSSEVEDTLDDLVYRYPLPEEI